MALPHKMISIMFLYVAPLCVLDTDYLIWELGMVKLQTIKSVATANRRSPRNTDEA